MAFHRVLAFVPLLLTKLVFLQTKVFSMIFSLKPDCFFLFMPFAMKRLRSFDVVGKGP